MDYQTDTLAEIARQIPGATRVFRKRNLDFCCSGNRTLLEALDQNSELADKIVLEIKALNTNSTAIKMTDLSDSDLVDYILNQFHDKHRSDLPELIFLARKVEHVHGEKSDCPTGLADHLSFIATELEAHMVKEEELLFPKIKAYDSSVSEVIQELEEEHDAHGDNLEKLANLLNQFEVPINACTTWRALILGCKTLVDEVMEHVHSENNILFPRQKSVTSGVS